MATNSRRVDDILLEAYERHLAEFRDPPQELGWVVSGDRSDRFAAMLDVVEETAHSPVVLCDFGCGTGGLLAYLQEERRDDIIYVGADRSALALAHAQAKFPDASFVEIDVNAPDAALDVIACDYLVANGLFIAKFALTQMEMQSFLTSTLERLWPVVRHGLALNLMSGVKSGERDDLFYLPMDEAARILHRLAGRVVLRADDSREDYVAYAYRSPRMPHAGLQGPVASTNPTAVPVLRPRLPGTDRLVPYLRRIDAARAYTNHGPLATTLEGGLIECLSLTRGGIACASSGTTALVGAILAVGGPAAKERPLALVPALTFVATAQAAELAGYRSWITDVDPVTWMLDPERLLQHPALEKVGVVVPVAPFGRPVPQAPWLEFRRRTGIPVVIDGAASFDRIASDPERLLNEIPVALSFHATKAFATGEGGCVVTTDPDLTHRVTRILNFGFYGTRVAQSAGLNGKMSEYHAAVGLAELDEWHVKKAALHSVIEAYQRGMARAGLSEFFIAAPEIGLSYVLFHASCPEEAEQVQTRLDQQEIDTRLWYGAGLHRQTYFADRPRDPLPVTEETAPCLVGLPIAPDLTEPQTEHVIAALAAALRNPG
jgi:dTDP-4-amino-4,6-dideoxygalactose transaminase/SAM-dependent methyltransferase